MSVRTKLRNFHYSLNGFLASWRPPLWGITATVAGLAVFVSLGLWQLERAEYKRAMLALEQAGSETPPVEDVDASRPLPEGLLYRRASLQGRYAGTRQVLLQSMTSTGRDGFQVLTPLHLASGDLLMVNRGWVPADGRGRAAADLTVDESLREVSGRLTTLPVPGLRLGGNVPVGPDEAGWPRVYLYPTADELSVALGEPVADMQLQLDASVPDGFERNWPTVNVGPERHIGYALQWFTFALVLVIIFFILTRPQRLGRHADGP